MRHALHLRPSTRQFKAPIDIPKNDPEPSMQLFKSSVHDIPSYFDYLDQAMFLLKGAASCSHIIRGASA